jgi:hypothetical protein
MNKYVNLIMLNNQTMKLRYLIFNRLGAGRNSRLNSVHKSKILTGLFVTLMNPCNLIIHTQFFSYVPFNLRSSNYLLPAF